MDIVMNYVAILGVILGTIGMVGSVIEVAIQVFGDDEEES